MLDEMKVPAELALGRDETKTLCGDSELIEREDSRKALSVLTDDLDRMADWFNQLRVEIRRAELLFDLGCLSDSHLNSLRRRVNLWCQASDAYAERVPGSLVETDRAQREAA